MFKTVEELKVTAEDFLKDEHPASRIEKKLTGCRSLSQ